MEDKQAPHGSSLVFQFHHLCQLHHLYMCLCTCTYVESHVDTCYMHVESHVYMYVERWDYKCCR